MKNLRIEKDSTLTPPTNKTASFDDEIKNDSHDYDAIMEQQLTADSKADIDDWVLVKYDNLVFIGIKKDLSENKCKVKCMHECGKNQFKWPIHSDECWYNSMLCVLNSPIPVNNHGVFKLQPGDFENFKKFLT